MATVMAKKNIPVKRKNKMKSLGESTGTWHTVVLSYMCLIPTKDSIYQQWEKTPLSKMWQEGEIKHEEFKETDRYYHGKYSGSVTSSYTIKKAKQKNVKVTNKYKATKAKTFKKKGKSYTFKATGVKGKAKVTYTASSKKIKVKNGKITLSKGIKKGTYKVTVKVAKTKNYSAYTKTVTIKVK